MSSRSLLVLVGLATTAACGRIGFDELGPPDPFNTIPDLVVRYPMDDDPSEGVAMATQPGYDGTCTICPAATTGHLGGGYTFAGTQWIDLPALASSLVGTSPYTVTVWILVASTPADKITIVEKNLSLTNNANVYKLYVDNGQVAAGYETDNPNTGIDGLDDGGPSVLGDWHAIATSWDGTSKRLYIDGVLTGTEPDQLVDSMALMQIGADDDNGLLAEPFTGALDELRFYRRTLDDAEVAELAQ